jgi:hypothetical protein
MSAGWWCAIHIDPGQAVLTVIAFHEKAGRSQVDSVVFLLDKVFSPAE